MRQNWRSYGLSDSCWWRKNPCDSSQGVSDNRLHRSIEDPTPVAGPDRALLGEVYDVLGLFVTWPWDVLLAWSKRHADRVRARDEVAVLPQHVVDDTTHTGHDAHTHRDIGRIGQLDARVGDRRAERSHT